MSRRSPEKTSNSVSAGNAPRRPVHRRHGYRGYGSGYGRGTDSYGGRVHWGSGFGGVGVPGGYPGITLPKAGLFEEEPQSQGPYWGIAPVGYPRSNSDVHEDICELDRTDDALPARRRR